MATNRSQRCKYVVEKWKETFVFLIRARKKGTFHSTEGACNIINCAVGLPPLAACMLVDVALYRLLHGILYMTIYLVLSYDS